MPDDISILPKIPVDEATPRHDMDLQAIPLKDDLQLDEPWFEMSMSLIGNMDCFEVKESYGMIHKTASENYIFF